MEFFLVRFFFLKEILMWVILIAERVMTDAELAAAKGARRRQSEQPDLIPYFQADHVVEYVNSLNSVR